MKYKVLLAERATKIIMNSNTLSRHITGGGLPYLFFETLAAALSFTNASVEANHALEVSIWNEEGKYEQTVATKIH